MTSLDGKAQETISARLLEHEKLVHKVMGSKRLLKAVEEAAGMISLTLASGGKVMFCGNGGSAADAQHWAAEIVGRFQKERPGMAALALTTDTSILTAIGNDYGYDKIFSRQVEGLGREGDVLVGISTSGNSPNVLAALEAARKAGLHTLGFTGNGGGAMAPLCDILLDVPHAGTPLIQETHIAAGHLLCQLTDYYLFENVAALQPLLGTASTTEV